MPYIQPSASFVRRRSSWAKLGLKLPGFGRVLFQWWCQFHHWHPTLESNSSLQSLLEKEGHKETGQQWVQVNRRSQKLRRLARRRRKGLDDRHEQGEGVMYAAGTFDAGQPGPSKRPRSGEQWYFPIMCCIIIPLHYFCVFLKTSNLHYDICFFLFSHKPYHIVYHWICLSEIYAM